jgi:hypothetical protein
VPRSWPWLLSICPGRRRRPGQDDERASTSYDPRRDSSHRAVNGPLGTVKRGELLADTRMSLVASPSPSSISHVRPAMASATISGSHTRCQVWTSVFGGSAREPCLRRSASAARGAQADHRRLRFRSHRRKHSRHHVPGQRETRSLPGHGASTAERLRLRARAFVEESQRFRARHASRYLVRHIRSPARGQHSHKALLAYRQVNAAK